MAAQLGILGGETEIEERKPANETQPAPVRKSIQAPRSRSIRARELTRAEQEDARVLEMFEPSADDFEDQRPKVRADCQAGGVNELRPCPWLLCRNHLYLDVNPESGSIKENFPHIGPEDLHLLPDTCALDVADRVREGDEMEWDAVGERQNVTGERLIQLRVDVYRKLRAEIEDDAR